MTATRIGRVATLAVAALVWAFAARGTLADEDPERPAAAGARSQHGLRRSGDTCGRALRAVSRLRLAVRNHCGAGRARRNGAARAGARPFARAGSREHRDRHRDRRHHHGLGRGASLRLRIRVVATTARDLAGELGDDRLLSLGGAARDDARHRRPARDPLAVREALPDALVARRRRRATRPRLRVPVRAAVHEPNRHASTSIGRAQGRDRPARGTRACGQAHDPSRAGAQPDDRRERVRDRPRPEQDRLHLGHDARRPLQHAARFAS